jgi:hypothetical protein
MIGRPLMLSVTITFFTLFMEFLDCTFFAVSDGVIEPYIGRDTESPISFVSVRLPWHPTLKRRSRQKEYNLPFCMREADKNGDLFFKYFIVWFSANKSFANKLYVF